MFCGDAALFASFSCSGADSAVLLVNSYQRFPRFSNVLSRTRLSLENFGKYLPKFGVVHDLTRRFKSFIPCSFASRRVGSCTARDLNFRLHLQEFLFGAACGLARVCDSSTHLNFRCVRSRVALRHNSRCSMCRQSPRQSARTMRSAAGKPNLGRCQSG